MSEESKLLWQQALFQAEAQSHLKIIEQQRYHEHGRLVPEMPTDNGALLRKAILADDCIKDLVRPLRDADWNVEVGEPDEDGLYVTVVATADGEKFGASLLFSCATSNDIYCKLAETLTRSSTVEHHTSRISLLTELMFMWGPWQVGSHRRRLTEDGRRRDISAPCVIVSQANPVLSAAGDATLANFGLAITGRVLEVQPPGFAQSEYFGFRPKTEPLYSAQSSERVTAFCQKR